MRTTLLYTLVAVTVVVVVLSGVLLFVETHDDAKAPDIYFGVDAAYDNTVALKQRVDQVKGFTNFFIVGSYGITFNETRVNDMCQYLYDNGLFFVVFAHTNRGSNNPYQLNQSTWSSYAKQTWGKNFVGFYAYDEPGGHQVDHDPVFMAVEDAANYSDAANKFVTKLKDDALLDFIPTNATLITSDYALYDFDYKGGYDVVLAELAWNLSRPISIALARGAATSHGKDWGVMLTYTYNKWPFLAPKQQMYEDLVLAYQNGAKYFVVFDYAKDPVTNATYGILDQTRLDAMEQFWNYAKHNPRPAETNQKTAYVLPKDYGYGFRGPDDKIWGLWEPDQLSSKVRNDVTTLTSQYGNALDIVYEDSLQSHVCNYEKLIFWNGTTLSSVTS